MCMCVFVCVCKNLTLRCNLLVQEPMTLYSVVDLLVAWYWKMSYLPGASPFSLNITGVFALPGTGTEQQLSKIVQGHFNS